MQVSKTIGQIIDKNPRHIITYITDSILKYDKDQVLILLGIGEKLYELDENENSIYVFKQDKYYFQYLF